MEFILVASDETLSTHSGLGLIGHSHQKQMFMNVSHIFICPL